MKKRLLVVVVALLLDRPAVAFDLNLLQEKIVMAESSGRPHAIGDHGKARGLMQLQRATWERFSDDPWREAFHPGKNLAAGRAYLKHILKVYGKKATKARVLYTYNTGRFCYGNLPKWTKRHPNKIYRRIFNER